MLSLRMIEDIKTIVKMPSVEGTFQQGAPFGKDIALTLDKVLEIAQSLGFETKKFRSLYRICTIMVKVKIILALLDI